jgi:transcriptional regulator with XRE-family HTH domain
MRGADHVVVFSADEIDLGDHTQTLGCKFDRGRLALELRDVVGQFATRFIDAPVYAFAVDRIVRLGKFAFYVLQPKKARAVDELVDHARRQKFGRLNGCAHFIFSLTLWCDTRVSRGWALGTCVRYTIRYNLFMPKQGSVAGAIKRARRTAGWSQADLGRAAGIPQSHVAKIELGIDMRASTLQRILGALGYEIQLRQNVRGLFLSPPPASRLAAARDFGVDLGQLYDGFSMSPLQRLDAAARSANGLAEVVG